jgi:hypothetical protein
MSRDFGALKKRRQYRYLVYRVFDPEARSGGFLHTDLNDEGEGMWGPIWQARFYRKLDRAVADALLYGGRVLHSGSLGVVE